MARERTQFYACAFETVGVRYSPQHRLYSWQNRRRDFKHYLICHFNVLTCLVTIHALALYGYACTSNNFVFRHCRPTSASMCVHVSYLSRFFRYNFSASAFTARQKFITHADSFGHSHSALYGQFFMFGASRRVLCFFIDPVCLRRSLFLHSGITTLSATYFVHSNEAQMPTTANSSTIIELYHR